MSLPMRSDVPRELTWDLSLIYPSQEAMNEDLTAALALTDEIESTYRDRLTTPEAINACLDLYRSLMEKMTLIGNYVNLSVSVDYTNGQAQQAEGRVMSQFAQVEGRLSFIDSQINAQSQEVLTKAMEIATANRGYLANVLRSKPHQLAPETEAALACLGPALDTPYTVYNVAKLADMDFGSFTAAGKEYPLGYSLFEDNYEYERDTAVRHAAFRAFYDKIAQYKNVTGAAYNAQVTKEKAMAGLRGFDSVFDSLLFRQKVTREMYDRQIDLIMERLAPHMRRYAKLLQRVHKLPRMTYADLKLAVDPDYDPAVTIEESREYIEKGLAILGPEYVEMVKEAYRDRWVDFAKNVGKSTGGFCASPYGRNSFILLTWNERMADVFTLAHELGHAGHFRECNREQSIFDTEVSSYFVEAPSTMNELLMSAYLLDTNSDKRFQRWVLSSMVGHTYYHNFVTHLLEAAYQREVYRLIDDGESVNASVLSDIYRKTLERFWGDAVELTEGAELTWMRQPHYYMGLYSYTYSAGLTVATQAAKRIRAEGAPAVEDWKKVLRAGSTLDPVGLAALAGIDITTDGPLTDTIEYIGSMIDRIIQLTDELEK